MGLGGVTWGEVGCEGRLPCLERGFFDIVLPGGFAAFSVRHLFGFIVLILSLLSLDYSWRRCRGACLCAHVVLFSFARVGASF